MSSTHFSQQSPLQPRLGAPHRLYPLLVVHQFGWVSGSFITNAATGSCCRRQYHQDHSGMRSQHGGASCPWCTREQIIAPQRQALELGPSVESVTFDLRTERLAGNALAIGRLRIPRIFGRVCEHLAKPRCSIGLANCQELRCEHEIRIHFFDLTPDIVYAAIDMPRNLSRQSHKETFTFASQKYTTPA